MILVKQFFCYFVIVFIFIFTESLFAIDRDPFRPIPNLIRVEGLNDENSLESSYDIINEDEYERVKLMGILYDEKQPFAVFMYQGAQRFYRVNHLIHSYKVIDIFEKSVVLQLEEKKVTFFVGDEQLL